MVHNYKQFIFVCLTQVCNQNCYDLNNYFIFEKKRLLIITIFIKHIKAEHPFYFGWRGVKWGFLEVFRLPKFVMWETNHVSFLILMIVWPEKVMNFKEKLSNLQEKIHEIYFFRFFCRLAIQNQILILPQLQVDRILKCMSLVLQTYNILLYK